MIMTPDNLHGVISMAPMKKGKHVMVHQPLPAAIEGKRVIAMGRAVKVITHASLGLNGYYGTVMTWIYCGSIGTLMEVHNWTTVLSRLISNAPGRYAPHSSRL